jgi:hypothetical protein
MGYLMTIRGDDPSVPTPKEGNSPSSDHHYPSDPGYAHYYPNTDHAPNNQEFAHHHHHFEHTMLLPNPDSVVGQPVVPTQNPGEVMMQPNAYLTVEYPVNLLDPCTNMTGTCQCGLNCACVGCLTHHGHNGVALEPSPPPEHPDFQAGNPGLPLMPDAHSAFQMPVYAENQSGYPPHSSCC